MIACSIFFASINYPELITELLVMLRRFVVDCSSIVPKYGSIFPGMVANLLPPFRQSKVNLFHINNMVIYPVDIDGALPSFIHRMNICKR